jgi:hypothetical protein
MGILDEYGSICRFINEITEIRDHGGIRQNQQFLVLSTRFRCETISFETFSLWDNFADFELFDFEIYRITVCLQCTNMIIGNKVLETKILVTICALNKSLLDTITFRSKRNFQAEIRRSNKFRRTLGDVASLEETVSNEALKPRRTKLKVNQTDQRCNIDTNWNFDVTKALVELGADTTIETNTNLIALELALDSNSTSRSFIITLFGQPNTLWPSHRPPIR